MQPLFAVHNNVSLLSINIAPSSFLAALIVAFVFLSLYLPRLPSLPRFLRFGRRTGKQDAVNDRNRRGNEVIVVQRHRYFVRTAQGLVEVEGPDEDDNSNQGYQFWRRPEDTVGPVGPVQELEYVDRRHRQLPPLPHPPLGEILDDNGLDATRDSARHKKGTSEKARKADKEALRSKAKQQQQKGIKSTKGSKSSSGGGSSSSAPSLPWHAQSELASATSSELVVRHSRKNADPIESPLTGSRDHDENRPDTAGSHIAAENADPTSWLSFRTAADAFGRLFTPQYQPDRDPSVDTIHPIKPLPEAPNTASADTRSGDSPSRSQDRSRDGSERDRQRDRARDREREHDRFRLLGRWLQPTGVAPTRKRRS